MPNYTGVANDEPLVSILTFKGLPQNPNMAMARVTQTLTPGAVAAATCAEQSFPVKGLQVGDFVAITPPSITAGTAPICARVIVPDTLTVTFVNATAGSLTPAAGVYRIQVMR